MARKCQISGVSNQFGHRVSHANNKTKHVFMANIQTKRIFIPELKKFVRVKVTTRMIRTIDKLGVAAALRKHGVSLGDIQA